MSVVLAILQGIGWFLLAVLFLVLLVLLAVLFAPVRYELEGDIREKQWAKAYVHWLLRLFRVRVVYEDDLIFVEIKILWITKTFSFELSKEKDEAEDTAEETAKKAEKEVSKETESEKKSIISKIKGILNRIREIYPKLKKIITDEKNKAAVVHLKNELIYLIKTLLPKESKIDAVFAAASPDVTGQAYGVIACLPIFYRDDWQLLPDFTAEEAYFHGYFMGKGRVYGYELVGIILRILFDKNCRRMYTIINKFMRYLKRKTGQEDK